LNNNFKNGLYLNQGTCTSGQIACAADGSLAICNFGNWVSMRCAPGTTCFAYNYGDYVEAGCNYIDYKPSFEKRSNEEGLLSFFKRYI
jgi:chitinase